MKPIVALLLLLLVNVARAQGDLSSKLTQIYEEEIEQAMAFAPPGKSMYQLRGDAQTLAQSLLDKLAAEKGYPRYQLSGIVFKPVIVLPDRSTGAAGTVDACDYPPFRMTLNEILFYRNYDSFMDFAIPHEVAHIAACLKSNNHGLEHGPEWEQAMRDLGFLNPQNLTRHDYDTAPIEYYRLRVRELLISSVNGQTN